MVEETTQKDNANLSALNAKRAEILQNPDSFCAMNRQQT